MLVVSLVTLTNKDKPRVAKVYRWGFAMLDIIIEQNVMQGEARKTWQWDIVENIGDIRKCSYENLSILIVDQGQF